MSLLSNAFRTALRPNQWLPGTLSMEVKRPGCEALHSPPSTGEAKKVALYLLSSICIVREHRTTLLDDKWPGLQIIKLLILKFSQFAPYFVPPRYKQYPQHSIVVHPQSASFPSCEGQSFTPIKTTHQNHLSNAEINCQRWHTAETIVSVLTARPQPPDPCNRY
jgi:hypothetical protein